MIPAGVGEQIVGRERRQRVSQGAAEGALIRAAASTQTLDPYLEADAF
jgi:hypothetical protein